MKIERVDDKTLKCFISNAELEEYNLDYKDFVGRTDKAKEIVHEIMEQAKEEVGFEPPKFAFDLQIMMVPEQGMVLTFSDKDSEAGEKERLVKYLQDMKDSLMNLKNAANTFTKAEGAKDIGNTPQASEVPLPNKGRAKNPSKDTIFSFESLGQIYAYVKVLPSTIRVATTLYKLEGKYYLLINKGGAAFEKYRSACLEALEFGSFYGNEPQNLLYLEEHGECLIRENAIKFLK